MLRVRKVTSTRRSAGLDVQVSSNVAGRYDVIATHAGPGGSRPRALQAGRGRLTFARTTTGLQVAGTGTLRLRRTVAGTRALGRYRSSTIRLRLTVRLRPAGGGRPATRVTIVPVRSRR